MEDGDDNGEDAGRSGGSSDVRNFLEGGEPGSNSLDLRLERVEYVGGSMLSLEIAGFCKVFIMMELGKVGVRLRCLGLIL